jgi:quinol monooxygenase YgiN
MDNRLRVLAKVSAKVGSVQDVRAILVGLVEPTRREVGCLTYQLLQSRSDPHEFVFVEEWESATAEQVHVSTAHVKEAIAKLAGHLATAPDIRRYCVVK